MKVGGVWRVETEEGDLDEDWAMMVVDKSTSVGGRGSGFE